MQWKEFTGTLGRIDEVRLQRWLEEARQFAVLASRPTPTTETEEIVGYIDRALDALAAARILLRAPPEPRPWADPHYRAYHGQRPATRVHMPPSELARLRAELRQRPRPPQPQTVVH